MKKFSISFLILAIFAGVIFSFGWVQIKVKPDSVGVIISKTNGINDKPVVPGEFYWSKQFLLPTNAELRIFKTSPLNVQKTVSGQLPSGELYTSIFNSQNNFQYKIKYNLSLSISPEAIVELLKENKISNNEDLEKYINGAADTIAQLATNYILEKIQENPMFRPESIRRDDLFRSIQVYKDFPQVDLSVFAITESILPDYKLYSQLQNQVITNQDKYNSNSSNQENEIIEEL